MLQLLGLFFFSSRRRHTRSLCDWSSDVCSSDLQVAGDSTNLGVWALEIDPASGRLYAGGDFTQIGGGTYQRFARFSAQADCTITGTSADDILTGTAQADVVCAGAGNDTVKGLGGNDVLNGQGGWDKLHGGEGDDVLVGGI